LAGVLFLGVAFEQRIEVGGGKGMFDEAAGHDAERAGGDERLEKGIQEHGLSSGRRIAISLPVLVFYQINNTLEGMRAWPYTRSDAPAVPQRRSWCWGYWKDTDGIDWWTKTTRNFAGSPRTSPK